MTNSKPHAVIFVFLNQDNHVLLEQRAFKNGTIGPHWVFPGGHVEAHETDLEIAVKREAFEELGIIPLEFSPIPFEMKYHHKPDLTLTPFLITKWQGEIPDQILDQGNPTTWMHIDQLLETTPLDHVKNLTQYLKDNY